MQGKEKKSPKNFNGAENEIRPKKKKKKNERTEVRERCQKEKRKKVRDKREENLGIR